MSKNTHVRRWRKPHPTPDYMKPEFVAQVRKFMRDGNNQKATREHFNLTPHKLQRILRDG